jgi:hypothetical protein
VTPIPPVIVAAVGDRFRMIEWLALAIVFYVLALYVFGGQPQLQTLCWKLGNLTVASFMGYWLDRTVFYDTRPDAVTSPIYHIRRAMVMAAAMIAVATGL